MSRIKPKIRQLWWLMKKEILRYRFLSGHIGGANDLAEKIAALTSGVAVITTATDINKKFSVDTFAVRNNLHIGDTKTYKRNIVTDFERQKSRIVYRLRIKKRSRLF